MDSMIGAIVQTLYAWPSKPPHKRWTDWRYPLGSEP